MVKFVVLTRIDKSSFSGIFFIFFLIIMLEYNRKITSVEHVIFGQ